MTTALAIPSVTPSCSEGCAATTIERAVLSETPSCSEICFSSLFVMISETPNCSVNVLEDRGTRFAVMVSCSEIPLDKLAVLAVVAASPNCSDMLLGKIGVLAMISVAPSCSVISLAALGHSTANHAMLDGTL